MAVIWFYQMGKLMDNNIVLNEPWHFGNAMGNEGSGRKKKDESLPDPSSSPMCRGKLNIEYADTDRIVPSSPLDRALFNISLLPSPFRQTWFSYN
jgi:hypothetical protein